MKQKWKDIITHNQLVLMLLLGGIVFYVITGRWRDYGSQQENSYGTESVKSEMDGTKDSAGVNKDGVLNAGTKEEKAAEQAGVNEEVEVRDEISIGTSEKDALPKEVVWHTVDDSYFDDALFIGDSRVVGLQDYGKMEEHATFYASTGLTIFRLLSAKIVPVEGQRKKISVEEALTQRQFGKIYLMVGINELDIGTVERFEETYKAAIERIMELQPNAIIYIQSIMKVTTKRAAKGDYVTNDGIMQRNDAIMKLADNEKIFYLDVNEAVCDESGGMNPLYTSDGVHLKVKYIPLWREYLENHAVLFE